jgi:hypothetical protein
MTTLIFWRAFAGPAARPNNQADFYDWSVHDAGAADNLTAAVGSLTATLADAATSLSLASTSAWPSKGGVWIGPNGANEAWEYCGYTGKTATTLTGLTRESATYREHNGVHTAGALAQVWYPLSANDGRLHVVEELLDGGLTTSGWSAELSGIDAPQIVFRQDHVVIVQTRESPVTGHPSAVWRNWLVGFLDASSLRDDATLVRSWTARLMSSIHLLGKFESRSVRVGDWDLVVHGELSSSTPLPTQAAHKESTRNDFTAAEPDLSAQSAGDGDEGTLWIADEMVGTPNNPSGYGGIDQFYIHPPLSLSKGYKWVEIANYDVAANQLVAWHPVLGNRMVSLPDTELGTADEDYMIICENQDRFLAENPSSRAKAIVDVEIQGAANFFDYVDWQGGALAIRVPAIDDMVNAMRWGTQTTRPDDPLWTLTGGYVAAPGVDQTARYDYVAGIWKVARAQSPGYQIKDDGNDAWIFVELPGMGLMLTDDMTATVPGAGQLLRIQDAQGPSTDGLPASGTLRIAEEGISYSSKTTDGVMVSGRGALGSSPVAHVAGDAVYLVHTQGTPSLTASTDALPILSTGWTRQGGTIYPAQYTWRWSMLAGVRSPGDSKDQYKVDYEIQLARTGHTTSSDEVIHSASPTRVKAMLIEFMKMTLDPARPRLNTLYARVDPAYYDGDHWLTGGETVGELIAQLVANALFPAGSVSVTAGGAVSTGHATEIGNTRQVMMDLADFGGSVIVCGLDSKLTIAPDAFWTLPLLSPTPTHTWTRTTAASANKDNRSGSTWKQVRLSWRTPDGSASGTAIWPSQPAWKGVTAEIDEMLYASQSAAESSARRRFWMAKYPYTMSIELAEGDLTVHARQVQRLIWQFAGEMQPVDRLLMVTAVDHLIENQVLTTMVEGLQVDREIEG